MFFQLGIIEELGTKLRNSWYNLLYREWQLLSWVFLLCFQVLPLDAKMLRTVISLSYGKSSLAENKSANFKMCN